MDARIAIDAQFVPGGLLGGIEQVVVNLVHALGKVDPETEYLILGHWRYPQWFSPYVGANQRIVTRLQNQAGASKIFVPASLRVPLTQFLRYARRRWESFIEVPPTVPESNGFYESLNAALVHFPFQWYVRSRLPSIYSPHDLQHLHLPQFFTNNQIAFRDLIYRAGCAESRAITVGSRWVKADLIQQYNIDPQKIYVTLWAAPTENYTLDPAIQQTIVNKHRLPAKFVLYPAQTWAHKNHLRLLNAIAMLKAREGITVNLVCTGKQNEFWQTIKKHIQQLGLEQQTYFLGFVEPAELRALYHLAQFVVYPSLFEGGGLPVLEAFHEGAPLACANVTSLPEYAGDAALYFDPNSVASIADAIKQMTMNESLRTSLRERGNARVRQFSWLKTAQQYRALYRKIAGVALSEQDRSLLAETL